MSSPKDYLGGFSFWQATALGVTVFHAKGHPINTMRSTGIGFCFQVSKKDGV